ncbi:hypothetical protein [Piscirickettsia litoralis]|uniref:FCP1 homology domain-containing protein n=1 Tax=Piscirickettsia litoralis TaxID=1891921 RepID=A0ABX3A615_9GAMM|nr:hypothetical protein [Piscirickettsia litoralis]ODN43672.1 hypothetical protein BGC07_13130 [Piscirickettsia litoralis]
MAKKVFVFDIDETLLSSRPNIDKILNKVSKTPSSYDPYGGYFGTCYSINKQKMKSIMESIIAEGHAIAFVTAGNIEKYEIRSFVEKEYGIDLGDSFLYFNDQLDKTPALKEIQRHYKCKPQDLIFTDNAEYHLHPARKEGFTTIYADNNFFDKTDGANYTKELESQLRSSLDISLVESEYEVIDKDEWVDLGDSKSSFIFFEKSKERQKESPLDSEWALV